MTVQLTLEEKIQKFRAILEKIEGRQVGLQESYTLIEELTVLKQEIDTEINTLETKLISLSADPKNNLNQTNSNDF
jgi:exonuclease VII small subunit